MLSFKGLENASTGALVWSECKDSYNYFKQQSSSSSSLLVTLAMRKFMMLSFIGLYRGSSYQFIFSYFFGFYFSLFLSLLLFVFITFHTNDWGEKMVPENNRLTLHTLIPFPFIAAILGGYWANLFLCLQLCLVFQKLAVEKNKLNDPKARERSNLRHIHRSSALLSTKYCFWK